MTAAHPRLARAERAARRVIHRSPRLVRIERAARVWRLATRNGLRYATHRVRRLAHRGESKAALDERFTIRSAEDVARELGNMKGVMMKFGQLLSFIMEALPDSAQQALSTLQADAPPMSPAAAADVVRRELGGEPAKVFLDWTDTPIAAASVGQVHRAVTRDGRRVAVKVQYPGVAAAIQGDLDNAEMLYRMFSLMVLKGLDARPLVDELRERMGDELDYRLEAANQRYFVDAFRDHPFISIPDVDLRTSTRRVLTTAWAPGLGWNEFLAQADENARQRAAESIWRFAQNAVLHLGCFNGDPHPGNYRFSPNGDVTFLDFGLVKRWGAHEWEILGPTMDAVIVDRDPTALVAAMESSGFLRKDHGLDPKRVYQYVSSPYRPYLTDEFTFTREFVKNTLSKVIDLGGPFGDVIAALNMPPSYVILDRVVWGVSALMGKLGASGPFRAMLMEYRSGGAPATPLGASEAAWRVSRPNWPPTPAALPGAGAAIASPR